MEFSIADTLPLIVPGKNNHIPLTILNPSSEAGIVTLSLSGLPGDWIDIPSPGYQIPAFSQEVVEVGIIPPLDTIGIFPITITGSSQIQAGTVVEIKMELAIAAISSISESLSIYVDRNQIAIDPGETISTTLIVCNRGNVTDNFLITVSGVSQEWTSIQFPAIQLSNSESKVIKISFHPPKIPECLAGTHPITIKVTSHSKPEVSVEIKTTLVVKPFSKVNCQVIPQKVNSGQPARIAIENLGNQRETLALSWHSSGDLIDFKPASARLLPIPAGRSGSLEFTARLHTPPFFSKEKIYPYRIQIKSSGKDPQTLHAELVTRGLIPYWIVPSVFVFCLLFFITISLLLSGVKKVQSLELAKTEMARKTATAFFILTYDADQDGLTNQKEAELGTNPDQPDTDGDGLWDSDEIQRQSNPLNPDTDGDQLSDGEEIEHGTQVKNADSDYDHIIDGVEVDNGTSPTNPDTDSDGIIDNLDLTPLDPNNPLLTITALSITSTPTQTPTPVVTLIPATSTPSPIDSPIKNLGSILFVSNRHGNPEIYKLNTNDFSVARLTDHPAEDLFPVFSPDYTHVAFTTNRDGNYEIYIMNADGSGLMNISNNISDDRFPSWSPDGQWIAFSSNRDGNWEIYIIRTDKSSLSNMTKHPADDSQPSWFIDRGTASTGEWIAFTTNRDGNREIYLSRPNGSLFYNATHYSLADDYYPAGSTNGTRISFTTDRNGNREIYIMNLDGSSQSNLTNNPAQEYYPAWSPDDQWIVFTTNRNGNPQVYAIRENSTEEFNVSFSPASDELPSWNKR